MNAKKVRNVDQNLLGLFWKLAEQTTSIRVDSSISIVNILCKKQNENLNDGEMCLDLEYSVERLVKGLASSRDAARLGFSLVLTELLRQLEVIPVEIILTHMKNHLSTSSKQDKLDGVFGQVFAYSALVRSGRLTNHTSLPSVFISLFHLSIGKSYILKACYEIILNLLSQISEDNFKKNIWPTLKADEHFKGGWKRCDADVLWLLFLCVRLYPNTVNKKFLRKKWDCEDLFAEGNFDNCKGIMKKTSNVLPGIHPLCSEFLLLVLNRKDFKEIWIQIIDENLFNRKFEQIEKAFVGFEIIKAALKISQKKKVVKCILSEGFRHVFITSYLTIRHPMNPAASQLAGWFCEFVKSCTDPDIQILVLNAFLLKPGINNLDKILNQREVSLIISLLLPNAVKELCEFLKTVVLGTIFDSCDDEVEETAQNRQQVQAALQIGTLVSHPATILDTDWRLDTIQFLFLHSFFTVEKPNVELRHCGTASVQLPKLVRDKYANGFAKTVESLYRRTENTTASVQQFFELLLPITDYADQLLEATENVTPVFDIGKVKEPWSSMKNSVKRLTKQSKKDGKTKESNAFQILFLQLGLQLFSDPDQNSEILEELRICCKKALKDRKHTDESSETDPHWIRVVVDILLSLESRESVHLRHIVSSVFPLLCPFITNEALQQILDVINPAKSSEESMLIEESDGENENEVEFESGSSSNEEEETNQTDASIVDPDFKEKIQNALGPAADLSDAESVVLTDSEMFKLDDALSEAFRNRKKVGHTQLSTEEKTMLNFRNRCFDLISIYLKSEPPMSMVLQCIQPILAAYEYGNHKKKQSTLFLKSVSSLQFLTRVKSFKNCDNVEESEIEALLDILIAKCHKETNAEISLKLYGLCIFLVRCFKKLRNAANRNEEIQQVNGKKPKYVKKYISTLKAFVNQTNSHMLPHFFVSLMDACPEFAWDFVKPLREYAFDSDIRLFKRCQCFALLLEALKFSKSQETVTAKHWLEFGNKTIPLAVETAVATISNSEIKPLYTTELLDVILTSHKDVKEKTNVSILPKHPELLTCLQNMTKQQDKSFTKKTKSLKKKIIFCLGGNISQKYGIHSGDSKTLKREEKAKRRQARKLKLENKYKMVTPVEEIVKKSKKRKLSKNEETPEKKKLCVEELKNGETDSIE